MASTYSDLKIELIGTGDQSGTWGTTTNNNLSTALGEAITGSADVSFSSADVTVTLTDTNAAQTARNLRLNLTGTSGGARNLILGSGCQIEKLYLINNGLADTVTVKNTSGSGIAVPAGKTMFVYNNGTNVVDALNYFSGTLVSSSATITGGSINGTTVGASTAAAGTFTSLSDSGNLTFTGTGNRITGDFSNATLANRVAFQSSTANGNTGIFLLPNGTSNISAIRAFNNSDPTNAAFIGFDAVGTTDTRVTSSITGTGTYLPLTMFTGGSERLRIDTSGNVGIGTSSPQGKLDVSTNATSTAGFAGVIANFVNADGAATSIYSTGYHVTGNQLVFRQASGTAASPTASLNNNSLVRILGIGYTGSAFSASRAEIAFRCEQDWTTTANGTYMQFNTTANGTTTSTERMRIDSSGNVVIGTSATINASKTTILGSTSISTSNFLSSQGTLALSSPANSTLNQCGIYMQAYNESNFAMAGSIHVVPVTGFRGNFVSTYMADESGGSYIINQFVPNSASTVERMRIDSAGNVGIGTTSPAFTFGSGVRIDRTGDTAILELSRTDAGIAGSFLIASGSVTNTMRSNGAKAITIFTDGSERMRIDSSGNVLVSKTSVADNVAGIAITPSSGGGPGTLRFVKTVSGGINALLNYHNGSYVGGINFDNTNTSFPTSSDIRLKKDIIESESASQKIDNIRIVSHGWKHDDAVVDFGIIAQELYEIMPRAVTKGDDGEDVETTWGVDYSKLVPMLIKAHQEQQTLITSLTERITALESK